MNRYRRLLIATVSAVAVVALLLGACNAGDDGATSGTTTDTTEVTQGAVVDWARPHDVDLGGGWSLNDTEGDGPFLTVLRDGQTVGFIEYLDFPLAGSSGGTRVVLDAHVAEFFEAIGSDRADAPIEGYRFIPDEAVHGTAADGAIVRYGFRGLLPDGSPSERTVIWAGVRAGRLVLVSAAANDPGGLFPPEGTQFTSAQLDEVADRLDRTVRASGLPLPQPAT